MVASIIVLFVVLTYPVVSYSIDAYTSFPQSENRGLQYLTSNVPLDNKLISIGAAGQLSSYTKPPTNYKFVYSTFNISNIRPDIIIFRNSYYFYISMRFDLSFENNTYTKLFKEINSSELYNKIYVSETVDIFIRNKDLI